MWLIAVMLLLMLPVTMAALVWLVVAAWHALDALLQGIVGALRYTWRAAIWAVCMTIRAVGLARYAARLLRDWHYTGSTWAGQYLQASWLAWTNMARRRYVAGQLRRLRRQRAHK